MAADTAVLLIVSGIGIAVAYQRRKRATLFCSVALICAAAACKFTVDFPSLFVSLHRLFPRWTAAVLQTSDPMVLRMILPATVVFVFTLTSVALFSLAVGERKNWGVWSAAFCGALLTSLGSLGLLALLSKLRINPQQSTFLTQMSPVTAVASCVLGISFCLLFGTRHRFARERLGITVAVLGLVALIVLSAGVDYAILSGGQAVLESRVPMALVSARVEQVVRLMQAAQEAAIEGNGYMFSGDVSYLAGYRESARLLKVRVAVMPNLPQTSDVTSRLKQILKSELDELEGGIEARLAGNRPMPAISAHAQAALKQSRDAIQLSQNLIDAYKLDVKRTLDGNAEITRMVRRTVICSFAVSTLLIGAALYLVIAEYRRWVAQQASLRKAELLLAQRVEEAQRSLRTALQFAEVAAWVWDPHQDTVLWSGPVERVFGVPDLDTYAKFRSCIHPDDRAEVDARVGETATAGADLDTDFRVVMPDGSVRWVAGRGGASFDGGQLTKLSGVNFDITRAKLAEMEIKAREQALRDRDMQLALVFDSVAIGDWRWDGTEDRAIAHPTVWSLFGAPYRSDGDKMEWFSSRIHPDDLIALAGLMKVNGSVRRDFDVDFRVVRPGGELRWLSCRGTAVFAKGHAVQAQGLIIDITERKQIELRLKESEAQFRQLADAMPQIVWQAQPDGRIDSFNRRWYELTGLAASTKPERKWLSTLHGDDRKLFLRQWLRSVRTGEPFDMEMRIGQGTGYRWYLTRAIPIREQRGQVVRWFGTTTDIHERKLAEENLESAVERRTEDLRRTLREKDVLFQEVHHRVKNNLQIINSLLRMQGETVKESPAQTALNEARERVYSMALIHERLYSDRRMDELDFGQYVRALVDSLVHSYSQSENIKATVDSTPVTLELDQAIPCGLILNELVTNSLKYAFPEGRSGTVAVSLKQGKSNVITLTVADDGVGLPPEFDPERCDSLGMSIVSALAKQLSGTFGFESRGGAHFSVSFELAIRHGEPVETAAPLVN